jgi:hypothetical protein
MALYTLYRVSDDDLIEVSVHKSLGGGFGAGRDAAHADPENAYALYLMGLNSPDQRVARFAFSRLDDKVDAANVGLLAGLDVDESWA